VRSLLPILLAAGLVSFAAVEAAEPVAPDNSASSSTDTSAPLQEVTVTAQHSKLDWAQRNELVQKATTFVYGIAAVNNYREYPARWFAPVCPLVTGLAREQGEFVLWRLSEIARAAGSRLGGETCRPNLLIFVTSQPKELLQAMENRHFGVSFGNATPSSVEQFIDKPDPVKVWRNTVQGALGPVYVVVDRTRLRGVSQGQFADYVGMVSLAGIKSTAHVGDAQTILMLFDGPPEVAPESLSDWDQEFLKILYHPPPFPSFATPRSLIARRMVDELELVH
jgi:hypothetical protein